MTDNDSNIPAGQPETIDCQHKRLTWHKSEQQTARGMIRVTWVFACPDCGYKRTESADYMGDGYYRVNDDRQIRD